MGGAIVVALLFAWRSLTARCGAGRTGVGRREDQTRACWPRAVLIAWGLKRHYADARADDLLWILSPTARLVGATTGATFVMQPGEGYFSRERLFLIEKSCAGINFMIAAFAMLVFALVHRADPGCRRRRCWV